MERKRPDTHTHIIYATISVWYIGNIHNNIIFFLLCSENIVYTYIQYDVLFFFFNFIIIFIIRNIILLSIVLEWFGLPATTRSLWYYMCVGTYIHRILDPKETHYHRIYYAYVTQSVHIEYFVSFAFRETTSSFFNTTTRAPVSVSLKKNRYLLYLFLIQTRDELTWDVISAVEKWWLRVSYPPRLFIYFFN